MRSKTTSTQAIHLRGGWHDRLGKGLVKRVTPLGLILMLFALFVPNIASAEIVTTTYDFTPNGTSNTDVAFSTTTESSCTFFQKIGDVAGVSRLAAQGSSWILQSGNGVRQLGLYNLNGNEERTAE